MANGTVATLTRTGWALAFWSRRRRPRSADDVCTLAPICDEAIAERLLRTFQEDDRGKRYEYALIPVEMPEVES